MAYGDYTYTVQDSDGAAIASVAISVYTAGTDTLASIYSDGTGTSLANPTSSDGSGQKQIFASAGYVDIKFFKVGYREHWERGVKFTDDTSVADTVTLYDTVGITAQDIIKGALRKLRVYTPGQTIPGDEVADNLETLNALLDYWNSQRLMVYALTTEAFSLTSGKSLYTIGPGGDFSTVRPDSVDVESSFIRDSSSNDSGLKIMTQAEYNAITLKSGSGLNGCPNRVWYDPKYPLGRIQFNCPLSSGYTFYLASCKPFTEFPDISTAFVFPAGYRLMFIYNLAVMLASEYGKPVTNDVGAIAAQTLSHIKAKNARPIMAYHGGVPVSGGGGSTFNTRTGNWE